jgi:hypothetical protein
MLAFPISRWPLLFWLSLVSLAASVGAMYLGMVIVTEAMAEVGGVSWVAAIPALAGAIVQAGAAWGIHKRSVIGVLVIFSYSAYRIIDAVLAGGIRSYTGFLLGQHHIYGSFWDFETRANALLFIAVLISSSVTLYLEYKGRR